MSVGLLRFLGALLVVADLSAQEVRDTLGPTEKQASDTPDPKPLIRVGSGTRRPTRIKMVQPVYPPNARAAGISGVVVLEVNIGVDGKVRKAKVLRSVDGWLVPLLDRAAVDAVSQWEYMPLILNGMTVPVITMVTVAFRLN